MALGKLSIIGTGCFIITPGKISLRVPVSLGIINIICFMHHLDFSIWFIIFFLLFFLYIFVFIFIIIIIYYYFYYYFYCHYYLVITNNIILLF